MKHGRLYELTPRDYFKEVLIVDGFRTETKKFYEDEEETEIAECLRGLKNAYYIAKY